MNRTWLVTWWPRLVAAGVVLVVLAPAAVASYLHARHVVQRHDPVMADWLPITTDGMLLAALVVIWARRATRDPAGRWVWLAFWSGGVVTVAANLAAVLPTTRTSLAVEAVLVAVWPPVTVAAALELAFLLTVAIRAGTSRIPMLGPKRPSWWQRRRMMRQWRRQLARVDDAAAEPKQEAPPAADGGVPATGGETGPDGGPTSQSDTPITTPPAPPDPDAQLYARVVDLMGKGYGRPRIYKELKPEYPDLSYDGKLRTLMEKRRVSTNGNGSGK
jgi:hypothetical protein